MSTNNFQEACATYKYLKERGYPEKASLKLVGDRHRLSRMQRNSLFRGVVADAAASRRRGRIIDHEQLSGEPLAVDWYNVLITVESYLRGAPLFIAEDGVVRDSSATHGSYRTSNITERAIVEIVAALEALRPSRLDVYLDAPIAFSGLMARIVRDRLGRAPFPCDVSVSPSADYPLKCYAGVVASSDSVILDSARSVVDLARFVLERSFGFTPPPLRGLFPEDGATP